MNGYIIKATYLTGPNKGSSYFLQKGGYVASNPDDQWSDDCYKTENICKSICRKMEANNKIEHNLETKRRIYQAKKGQTLTKFAIYELMKYEPYFVKTVHPSNVF